MKACRAAYPDRKSTRLNSSHLVISYAVFCLKNTGMQGLDPAVQALREAGGVPHLHPRNARAGGARRCAAGGNDLDTGFFFNDTATTEIYTLSLHDALPI